MNNNNFNNLNSKIFFKNDVVNFTLFSLIFGLLMYIFFLKYYIKISYEIVPWGDPFTYEIGYYRILNEINNGDYFTAFQRVFGGNWYWLQNFLIFILSPILSNDPYSLSLINYLFYSLASVTLYILLINLEIQKHLSKSLALLIWLWPVNYHFAEYSALPVMGLDSTFLASLYCMVFSYLNFLIKTECRFSQVLFGFFLSASLVGRGNSITVIGLLTIFPTLYFLTELFKKKLFFKLKDFIVPIIFFVTTILVYYYMQLKKILEYYAVFKGFLGINFELAYVYLKNIPGIFFYYPDQKTINLVTQTDFVILAITIVSHLINFFVIYKARKLSNEKIKIFLFSGIFIFYGTFLINLFLWTNPHISIYNAQLIWAPMRIGFVIVVCSLFYFYKKNFSDSKSNLLFFLFIFLGFSISTLFYNINKKELYKHKIDSSPEKIKKIGNFIINNSQNGKGIILWYDPYVNPRIVAYYQIKENKEVWRPFRGKYADEIWNQSYNATDFQIKVQKEIQDIFLNVDFLVLNENSENYSGGSYAYYRYINFVTEQIKQGLLDKFVVIAKTKTSKGELFFFKREKNSYVKKNFKYEFKGDNYKIKTNANIEIF